MLEVEYYRRLAADALGREVTAVAVPDPHCLRGPLSARALRRALLGRSFHAARRRGKLLALDRPFLGTQLGGDALLIDADNYVEIHQPVLANAGAMGPAQASATRLGVTTDAKLPSMGGHFASAYPLYDGTNRMVVSWSPCLVLDMTVTPAETNVCTAANTSVSDETSTPPGLHVCCG